MFGGRISSVRQVYLNTFVDFRDLFVGVLNSNDPELADRFAMVGWSIWFKRNADRTVQGSLPYD